MKTSHILLCSLLLWPAAAVAGGNPFATDEHEYAGATVHVTHTPPREPAPIINDSEIAAATPPPAPAQKPASKRPAVTRLQAFHATYEATLNGMPAGVKVGISLKPAGNTDWTLSLDASSGLMKYHEESTFTWQDCRARPQRYRYDFSGLGMRRKLWLDFDHATRRATGVSRKGPLEFAFPDDMNDELGLTMAARCQFADGMRDTTFNVATTKGMRQLSYRLAGQEKVETPWGTVEALRIERVRDPGDGRRSTLWIAPSLAYLMVKMEHVEKIGVRGTVALKTLKMGSDPLEGLTATAAP